MALSTKEWVYVALGIIGFFLLIFLLVKLRKIFRFFVLLLLVLLLLIFSVQSFKIYSNLNKYQRYGSEIYLQTARQLSTDLFISSIVVFSVYAFLVFTGLMPNLFPGRGGIASTINWIANITIFVSLGFMVYVTSQIKREIDIHEPRVDEIKSTILILASVTMFISIIYLIKTFPILGKTIALLWGMIFIKKDKDTELENINGEREVNEGGMELEKING